MCSSALPSDILGILLAPDIRNAVDGTGDNTSPSRLTSTAPSPNYTISLDFQCIIGVNQVSPMRGKMPRLPGLVCRVMVGIGLFICNVIQTKWY